MLAVVVVIIIVIVMLVDGNAPVICSADCRAVSRGVSTNSNHRGGRDLRTEDEIALGIGRYRMRSARHRNGFDQYTRSVDDAQNRRYRTAGNLAKCAGSKIIAPVALVEPDFVRSVDTSYDCGIFGR